VRTFIAKYVLLELSQALPDISMQYVDLSPSHSSIAYTLVDLRTGTRT